MNIDASNCVKKKEEIQEWVVEIIKLLFSDDCPLPNEMKLLINDRLSKVTIKCKDCPTGQIAGHTTGSDIELCKGTAWGEKQVVLFHELVHAVGGTELDAEALENHCFVGKGATQPTEGDWKKMIDGSTAWDGLRVGTFVIWDPEKGDKWVNIGTKEKPKKGEKLRKNAGLGKEKVKKLIEEIEKEKKKKLKRHVKKSIRF